MPPPEDFGRAVFTLQIEDRKYTESLLKNERRTVTSTSKMSASFDSVRAASGRMAAGTVPQLQQTTGALSDTAGAATATQAAFLIVGPAASAMGGRMGAAAGQAAGLGSAMFAARAVLLGWPGLILVAVGALALLVKRLVDAKNKTKELTKAIIEQRAARFEARMEREGKLQTGIAGTETKIGELESLRETLELERKLAAARSETQRAQIEGDQRSLGIQKRIAAERLAITAGEAKSEQIRTAELGARGVVGRVAQRAIDATENEAKARRRVIMKLQRLQIESDATVERKKDELRRQREEKEIASAKRIADRRQQAKQQRQARITGGDFRGPGEALQFFRSQIQQVQNREQRQEAILGAARDFLSRGGQADDAFTRAALGLGIDRALGIGPGETVAGPRGILGTRAAMSLAPGRPNQALAVNAPQGRDKAQELVDLGKEIVRLLKPGTAPIVVSTPGAGP